MDFTSLSPEQQRAYYKCVLNLKVGDKIQFYTSTTDGCRVFRVSENSDEAEVVMISSESFGVLSSKKEFAVPFILFGSKNKSFFPSDYWDSETRRKVYLAKSDYPCFMTINGLFIKRVIKKQ